MGDIEETVSRTLGDVKKLEDQIDALLCSLKNNDKIVEANLIPVFPLKQKTSKSFSKKQNDNEISTPMEVDDDEDCLRDILKLKQIVTFGSSFVPSEADIFLIPVFDKWVFGVTLTNVSSKVLCRPDLILSLKSKNSATSCSVFSYNVRAKLIEVDIEKVVPTNRMPLGIPYQEPIIGITSDDLNLKKVQMVQSGCKLLLTATFDHPLIACDENGEFTLLISICSAEGEHMWSRSLNVNYLNVNSLYKDNIYRKHRLDILFALSKCQDVFKMDQFTPKSKLSKQVIDLSPLLLDNLGFEKLDSDFENNTKLDTFIPPDNSILSGSIFQLENYPTGIRCSVSTKFPEQMQIITKAFSRWLEERTSSRKSSNLTISALHGQSLTEINKVMASEVANLVQLIHLTKKGLQSQANSTKDLKWMKKYYECLVETDSAFIKNVSSNAKDNK